MVAKFGRLQPIEEATARISLSGEKRAAQEVLYLKYTRALRKRRQCSKKLQSYIKLCDLIKKGSLSSSQQGIHALELLFHFPLIFFHSFVKLGFLFSRNAAIPSF